MYYISMKETNKGNKMNEKRYTLDEVAICNHTQDHIFALKEARKFKGMVFCSKNCKDGYRRDYGI